MSCSWQTSTLILMTDQKLRVVHDKRPLGPGEAIRGPFFDVADGPPTQDFGQTELLDREPVKIARAHPLIASKATQAPLPAVLLTAALLKRTRARDLVQSGSVKSAAESRSSAAPAPPAGPNAR